GGDAPGLRDRAAAAAERERVRALAGVGPSAARERIRLDGAARAPDRRDVRRREHDRRGGEAEVLRAAAAGPEVDDLVGRVAVAVEIDAPRDGGAAGTARRRARRLPPPPR